MTARTLHLIDLENLAGGGGMNLPSAQAARERYEQQINIDEDDLVVVASGPSSVLVIHESFRGARQLVGRGLDGADRALIDVVNHERIAERFPRVVVASGDAIFCDAVSQLGGQGTHVIVASDPGRLSRRLRLAACAVVELTAEPSSTPISTPKAA